MRVFVYPIGLLFLCSLLASSTAFAQALIPAEETQFDVLQVAPVEGIKSGERPLGLRYRTTHLEDAAAIADEASELMSRLLPEAERGGFQSALISAVGPESGAIITHSKGFNTLFERRASGEWTLHGAEETPRLAGAVAASYARADSAFQRLDVTAMRAALAPDFINYLPDGTQTTLAKMLAGLAAFKAVASWHTTVQGFFLRKQRVWVAERQEWVAEVWDERHQAHRVKDVQRSADVCVFDGKELKLSRSRELEEKMTPLN